MFFDKICIVVNKKCLSPSDRRKWQNIMEGKGGKILTDSCVPFQSKTIPGHFLMSYLYGLAELSPKLASIERFPDIETVG
jgi:hypothetical protein